MHIGHNHDDIDQESLALRHLGEGISRESAGDLATALNEYMVAKALDPDLTVAQVKLDALRQKLNPPGNS